MKLARKLTFALLLGIALVMGVSAWLQVSRERELFATDTAADELDMARAVRAAAGFVAATEGAQRAEELVRVMDAAEQKLRLRWIALDPAAALPAPLGRADLELLRAGREVTLVGSDAADARRFTYVPVPLGDTEPFALEVSESLAPQARYIRDSQIHIVLETFLIIVVCGLVVRGLGVWLVGRPIQALSENARRVGAGDLSGRIELRQDDEIGTLAREMNAMCERLATAQKSARAEAEMRLSMVEQLRHADRLKTVGQLASGVAHELGTPLNVVGGRAKLIAERRACGDDAIDSARIIVEQAERMATIIRQLLDFSRRREPRLVAGDVARIAERTVEMLATIARKSRVALAVEADASPTLVVVDHAQIQQVLTNLIVNAIQASPQGAQVLIRIGRERVRPPGERGIGEAEYAFVRVVDRGHGIVPANLPHVFDPFFTTKQVGEGTGLGLAVSYGIVRDHDGWIVARSEPGEGSEFTVFLPLAAAVEQERRELAPAETSA